MGSQCDTGHLDPCVNKGERFERFAAAASIRPEGPMAGRMGPRPRHGPSKGTHCQAYRPDGAPALALLETAHKPWSPSSPSKPLLGGGIARRPRYHSVS